MKRKNLGWLVLVVFCAVGCTKSGNAKQTTGTDIFPDKVGDSWIYRVNDTTVDVQDSTAAAYMMTVSVVDSTQLPQGVRATVWLYSYDNKTDTNFVFQKNDTLIFLDKSKTYVVRQYIIPLRLQSSWPYVEGIRDVTVGGQANISVNQINFAGAYHIFGDAGLPDGFFSVDEWVVDHIGIVKRYINPDGELLAVKHVISWSLLSYHLK